MHPSKRFVFPVAVLLLCASAASQASDLALPFYSLSQRSSLDTAFDPNDPAIQVAGIDEVDVWARMRKGFAIPDLDNPLVVNHVIWYTSRPDYIQRTTIRASRYLFYVVQELEKRNMPTELALLPFIESAFNPQAYSTAKAAGMWQFVPSTGRDFKLNQSMFKDDRRNVLASTNAALTYLQRLYGMFGDWQLALAAYNWGEGSVQRAINRNRAAGLPTDFNGLSPIMPLETRNYVPKLQAVKNIIATPEQYGIVLPPVDNRPYFVTVEKTRDIDIKVAAQLAELSVDEFKALNPQFNRPVITGNTNTQILLPQSNAEKFKENLAKWGRALSSWTSHKVTSARERIETIAKKFGTTPAVIREVNQIPPKMHLKQGSTILVPKSERSMEKDVTPDLPENATMAMVADVQVRTRKQIIRVGKKDTLELIAKRHKVTVEQIKEWNKLRQTKLAAGQTLRIEVPYKAGPAKHAGRHVASKGKGKVIAAPAKGKGKVVAAHGKPAKKTASKAKHHS